MGPAERPPTFCSGLWECIAAACCFNLRFKCWGKNPQPSSVGDKDYLEKTFRESLTSTLQAVIIVCGLLATSTYPAVYSGLLYTSPVVHAGNSSTTFSPTVGPFNLSAYAGCLKVFQRQGNSSAHGTCTAVAEGHLNLDDYLMCEARLLNDSTFAGLHHNYSAALSNFVCTSISALPTNWGPYGADQYVKCRGYLQMSNEEINLYELNATCVQYVLSYAETNGVLQDNQQDMSDKQKQGASFAFRYSAGVAYVLALVTIVCSTRLLTFFRDNTGVKDYELTKPGQRLVRRSFHMITVTFMLALTAAGASIFIVAFWLIGGKVGLALLVVAVLAGVYTMVLWAVISVASRHVAYTRDSNVYLREWARKDLRLECLKTVMKDRCLKHEDTHMEIEHLEDALHNVVCNIVHDLEHEVSTEWPIEPRGPRISGVGRASLRLQASQAATGPEP